MTSDAAPAESASPDQFGTTRWSVVLSCGDPEAPSQAARDALTQLCQTYWRPIFAFICRRGYSVSDAQDMAQDFFLAVFEGKLLQRADPERGKFRGLLLKSLRNFMDDANDRKAAHKRGGHVKFVSWDDWMAEAPSHLSIPERALAGWPAERIFDLRWAATVVERALRRLGEECERHGRRRLFDILSGSLMAERGEVSMIDLVRQTGLANDAVKRVLHQMRERYRALLREEVADTVEKPESINEEVRYLCSILASRTE